MGSCDIQKNKRKGKRQQTDSWTKRGTRRTQESIADISIPTVDIKTWVLTARRRQGPSTGASDAKNESKEKRTGGPWSGLKMKVSYIT